MFYFDKLRYLFRHILVNRAHERMARGYVTNSLRNVASLISCHWILRCAPLYTEKIKIKAGRKKQHNIARLTQN